MRFLLFKWISVYTLTEQIPFPSLVWLESKETPGIGYAF